MPQQSAYDARSPNGSARDGLTPGKRPPIHVYRLYRRADASLLTKTTGEGLLKSARRGLQAARNFIRGDILSTLSPLPGRILVAEYRFPLIIDRVDRAGEMRSRFAYVQNGYFIDTPGANAKGVVRWSIAGHTHWTPALVNGVKVDGDAALKDFEELIDDLFFPRDGRPSEYELWWLNLNAPISAEDPFGELEWKIWPLAGVRESQTSQRPLQRAFRFDFIGLESNRDRAKAEDGLLAGLMSGALLKGLLDKLGSFGKSLQDVFGLVDEFLGFLSDVELLIAAVNDFIRGVTQFIKAAFAKLRSLLGAIDAIIARVEEGWELARNLPDVFGEQLTLLKQRWPGLHERPSRAFVALREANALRDFLLALAAQPQHFADVVPAAAGVARSLSIKIPSGTSIEQIAHQHNVSVDTVIEANRLRFPFIAPGERPDRKVARIEAEIERFTAINDEYAQRGEPRPYSGEFLSDLQGKLETALQQRSDSSDGVLYPGDELRIPQPSNGVVPSIVGFDTTRILSITGREKRIEALTGKPVTEEDRLFGFDLFLSRNGDLEWDRDTGELRIERGLEHMGLVLERYFWLEYGSLRFAPGVGSLLDIGDWQGPGSARLRAYAAWSTLNQDPRVREIRGVQVQEYGGVASLVFGCALIGGRNMAEQRVGVG